MMSGDTDAGPLPAAAIWLREHLRAFREDHGRAPLEIHLPWNLFAEISADPALSLEDAPHEEEDEEDDICWGLYRFEGVALCFSFNESPVIYSPICS